MLNLFDESEDFPPIPSPFEFGPLPPCPASTPSPKMEKITEVTETYSSSSATGSIPQTEVEVLDLKEIVMSPRLDKEEIWTEQASLDQNERMHDMKTEDIDQHSKHDIENTESTLTLKRNKKEKKAKEQKSTKSIPKANRKKREKAEYCTEHQLLPTDQYKHDEEVLSIGSPCDCPAHVHDRESPLKIAEVKYLQNMFILLFLLFLVLNFGKLLCLLTKACLII